MASHGRQLRLRYRARRQRLGSENFKRVRRAQQERYDKNHLASDVAGQAANCQGKRNQGLYGLADSR